MINTQMVSKYLSELGQYPVTNTENEDGILMYLNKKYNHLELVGSPNDLIELADYLVSLALSGKNTGQHWHLDYLVSQKSEISELILSLNS